MLQIYALMSLYLMLKFNFLSVNSMAFFTGAYLNILTSAKITRKSVKRPTHSVLYTRYPTSILIPHQHECAELNTVFCFPVNDCATDRQEALDDDSSTSSHKYIPECTSDGRYKRVQCYKSVGEKSI